MKTLNLSIKNDVCVIYVISNNFNNKVYIGQTWRPIKVRFKEHKSKYDCIKLYKAIKKYGIKNFNIQALYSIKTQEDADFFEDYFIVLYNSIKNGYNIKTGGKGGKHSDQTKKKISNSLKGRICSQQTRDKISKSNSAENHWNYGGNLSEETKKKLSISHSGIRNYMFGKTHTEEVKKLISSLKFGKKLSLETRKKMSLSSSGDKNPMWGKRGIDSPNYGRKHSQETKEKIRLANSGINSYFFRSKTFISYEIKNVYCWSR